MSHGPPTRTSKLHCGCSSRSLEEKQPAHERNRLLVFMAGTANGLLRADCLVFARLVDLPRRLLWSWSPSGGCRSATSGGWDREIN